MDDFDKRMALEVVEDAMTALNAPENRGYAIGLCGGFYLCGLLSEAEWKALVGRIVNCHAASGTWASIMRTVH